MDDFTLPSIPPHVLQPGVEQQQVNAEAIFTAWLSKLDQSLSDKSFSSSFPDLFLDDCWWRDFISLKWDFSAKHGQPAIIEYLSTATNDISELRSITLGGLKPVLVVLPGMIWIQGGFTFKNQYGTGRGLVKLINVGTGNEWKAWTVFTQLEQLNFQGQVEQKRTLNPAAAIRQPLTNGSSGSGENGDDDLQVLVVGAGQAGLALGARLKAMGIKALLVDKHPRLGGAWRARYKSVYLNTPTYTDHPPFMKIPENWPRWLCRDQVADFWEHYGQIMGLDVLSSAEVTKVDFDETSKRYQVHVKRGEWSTVISPKHVVLATGTFSDKPNLPDIPGQASFNGRLYHSSEHTSAYDIPEVKSKKVVVIGAGSSGHDVAQDFVNSGAKEVSMVQRHPIFYLSAESSEAIQLMLWNMEGITTEEADLIGNATPLAVIRTMSIGMTHMMTEIDKTMIEGLKKAGMALKTGLDGYGLADYQLIKGGHFYVDQGAGQMIVDGRIKIHRCEEGIKEFQPEGLELVDGTKIEADIVVLATGYHSSALTVGRLMGSEVAKKMPTDFGVLDKENERSGWWRPTGQPGFWYMTGSFMWCRQFSLPLALQIAAIEKGLNDAHYAK